MNLGSIGMLTETKCLSNTKNPRCFPVDYSQGSLEWFLYLKYFCIPVTGLLVTYVALNLMDGHGQPALLYIVPFTLGNLFFL